jgi:hypothetical protein
MKCGVCGLGYEIEHICRGPIGTESDAHGTAPKRSALAHYLRLSWRIVCWDDAAIREAADDAYILPYGFLIWTVSITLPLSLAWFLASLDTRVTSTQAVRLVLLGLVSSAVYGFVHMGICHLIAKYFCAGDGHFIQVIRPLLLAGIIYLLVAVPILGPLLAPIAWICAVTAVFAEVHGIEPLTTFLFSAIVGFALRVLSHFLLHTRF